LFFVITVAGFILFQANKSSWITAFVEMTQM